MLHDQVSIGATRKILFFFSCAPRRFAAVRPIPSLGRLSGAKNLQGGRPPYRHRRGHTSRLPNLHHGLAANLLLPSARPTATSAQGLTGAGARLSPLGPQELHGGKTSPSATIRVFSTKEKKTTRRGPPNVETSYGPPNIEKDILKQSTIMGRGKAAATGRRSRISPTRAAPDHMTAQAPGDVGTLKIQDERTFVELPCPSTIGANEVPAGAMRLYGAQKNLDGQSTAMPRRGFGPEILDRMTISSFDVGCLKCWMFGRCSLSVFTRTSTLNIQR